MDKEEERASVSAAGFGDLLSMTPQVGLLSELAGARLARA